MCYKTYRPYIVGDITSKLTPLHKSLATGQKNTDKKIHIISSIQSQTPFIRSCLGKQDGSSLWLALKTPPTSSTAPSLSDTNRPNQHNLALALKRPP